MSTQEQILQGLVAMIAEAVAERMQFDGQRLLSVNQAAKYLGRTAPAIRGLIAKGTLPCVRRDGRVQLDRRDLDEWLEMGKSRG